MIRRAVAEDVPQMVTLSAAKRVEYQAYAPTFWRVAEDASEKHSPFLSSQIDEESAICLVYEYEGKITGFIIANITTAPPVYDPGSLVCVIDDFAVASSDLWDTVGRDLLSEVRCLARLRGAELSVVVCAQKDDPKREMLKDEGLYVASEWYVSP